MRFGQPRGPWVDVHRPKTALPGSSGDVASNPPPVAAVTQLIALSTWANAFLRKGFDAHALNRDHSTLRVCNKVAFADLRGLLRVREVPIAADPLTWFRWLRDEDCKSVRLLWFPRPQQEGAPERKSDAREQGWLLECLCGDGADRWRGQWDLTNRYAPQNRSWSVVYTRIGSGVEPSSLIPAEAETFGQRLVAAIENCRRFAAAHDQEIWLACLEQGKELLQSSRQLEESQFPHLLPRAGGTGQARQILACCCEVLSNVPKNEVFSGAREREDVQSELNRLVADLQAELVPSIEWAAATWAED